MCSFSKPLKIHIYVGLLWGNFFRIRKFGPHDFYPHDLRGWMPMSHGPHWTGAFPGSPPWAKTSPLQNYDHLWRPKIERAEKNPIVLTIKVTPTTYTSMICWNSMAFHPCYLFTVVGHLLPSSQYSPGSTGNRVPGCRPTLCSAWANGGSPLWTWGSSCPKCFSKHW